MENLGFFIINLLVNIMDFFFTIAISPILTFIANGIPDFDNAVASFRLLVDLIFMHMGWLLDFTGLSDFTINLIVGYLIFKISALLFEKPIKLFFKYWETLI